MKEFDKVRIIKLLLYKYLRASVAAGGQYKWALKREKGIDDK